MTRVFTAARQTVSGNSVSRFQARVAA